MNQLPREHLVFNAKTVCIEFLNEHHSMLKTVESYLSDLVKKTEDTYSKAYEPWLKGIQDMCVGIFIVAKGMPLTQPSRLVEALKMFTFESALNFIDDMCKCCQLALKPERLKKFRQDIDRILFNIAHLQQGLSQGHTR